MRCEVSIFFPFLLIHLMVVILRWILHKPFALKFKLCIDRIRQNIFFIGRQDPTLKGIRVYNFSESMHDNTATSFFSEILISIFCIHVFLTEIAVIVFETFVVHSDKFTKDLALNLLDKIVNCITIDKVSFLCVMWMNIKIKW